MRGGMKDFLASENVRWALAMIALGSFFIFMGGVCSAQDDKPCEYPNLASRIAIPYVIGCELFEKRW